MSDAGEGSLLQKAPLPHAPSSLPPKTFDLIESPFPGSSYEKGLLLCGGGPFLFSSRHRRCGFPK